jgi:hypothetical protein
MLSDLVMIGETIGFPKMGALLRNIAGRERAGSTSHSILASQDIFSTC